MTEPTPTAQRLLAADGPLSATFPGYESRPGQLTMAAAVEETLRNDGILLCEAGTGTGKTLAYLVPAILSGRKVVVSTATRALQEQIATRDLPMIGELLGLSIHARVVKGLSNYLCLRRFEAARITANVGEKRSLNVIGEIEHWRRTTLQGDISELHALSENDSIWREVTSSSDTRVGSRCAHHADCFVTKMKREAEQARLLIVNHHLFFADLALRGAHPGRVLPNYDCVIFDEAHQLESIATDFFGRSVSSGRIEAMLREGARALELARALGVRVDAESPVRVLRVRSEDFWQAMTRATEASPDTRVVVERDLWSGAVADAWHALDTALEQWSETCARAASGMEQTGTTASGALEALEQLSARATESRNALSEIAEGANGYVSFLERSARTLTLSSRPVDLSHTLRDRIFETVPAAVLTSATLATDSAEKDGAFRYVRRRLGLSPELAVTELVVPTPFDLENQALLYTPKDLPSPRDPVFTQRAAERISELVRLTDGGAFVLTTSLRAMRQLSALLRRALPDRDVLLQGDAPKNALLQAFRGSGRAVLVATLSFWEGVDVPGRALRLVILEKVPFSVPTDPVLGARSRALEEEGGNPFMDLVVPQAAITLKQGFGRLIRTKDDRGIVALLDERVHRRGYGTRLLRSLPPAKRTHLFEDVRQFCTKHALGAAP
ncbi:MAG TPA: ATP-dependent DNA helicase [Polyangiaceae bacterium]|nr:ATP-dependent DNA helicase [Polyangiaceae bacterium]HMR76421.1 ATP-dependent DNA helicase [Polyangiaceae bacterium]